MKQQIEDKKPNKAIKKIDKDQNKKEDYLKALIKSINTKHDHQKNL